ncbi:hypothetical protein ACFE04_031184 [Oxalis oulophora]
MTTLHKPHHHISFNVDNNNNPLQQAVNNHHSDEDDDDQHQPSSSSSSSSSSEIKETEQDLELGVVDDADDCKVSNVSQAEIVCRICHLCFDSTNEESGGNGNGNGNGIPIELGCSCKHDLAAAHKHCAEAWFKIKGNKTCEICGSIARNIAGATETEPVEQWNETNDSTGSTTTAAPVHTTETRHFWQGHQFLNFLLACMVFAFVISWLFHFNVPS